MNKTLKTTISGIALVIFTIAAAFQGVHAAGAKEYTKEIAPGVYSYGSGRGYHSMFLVTDDGVAVFETVRTEHAELLVKAVAKVTDQPIKYAFHSHNHWDHSGGGKVFKDLGAETVMHTYAAAWLEANPGADTSPPTKTWEGPRKDFKIGGKTIEAHYLGLNHGLGMTVFVLPDTRTAYIADLVTPNRLLFSIMPDFNIKEWERSLEEILALEFDKAVCSHSQLPDDVVGDGCNKTHVQAIQQYLKDLRAAVLAELKKGTPSTDVPGAIELPQYSHWAFYEEWLALNAWRMMLDMWMGPYPWVPGQSNP